MVDHPHQDLEDTPKVAAIDDGGPPIDPGRLTKPVDFAYEVSPFAKVERLGFGGRGADFGNRSYKVSLSRMVLGKST
jgi:hypothetical protein